MDDCENIIKGDNVIFIIEDDVNFVKVLLEFIYEKGYKGVVVVCGDEGVVLVEVFLLVGILFDIELLIKSGWEVMDDLKISFKIWYILVYMMLLYKMKCEGMCKGVIDFIEKLLVFE